MVQGWNFIGPGGIYFPRNDIPKWLTWANDGAAVNFQVPQISNCNVIALSVCFTLLDNGVDQGRLFPDTLGLWVTNHTKRTSFFNHSENYYEESSRLCEYLWLGHISNNKFNFEGGDLVEVFVRELNPSMLRWRKQGSVLYGIPNRLILELLLTGKIGYFILVNLHVRDNYIMERRPW